MTIWEHITNFFHVAEDVAAAAIKAFAEYLAENGGDVLMQSAIDAVNAAEAAGGSGAVKFSAATSAIREDMFTKGLTVAEHAIQSAVLAAVSQLKLEHAKNVSVA
jgi:hypothetical protein